MRGLGKHIVLLYFIATYPYFKFVGVMAGYKLRRSVRNHKINNKKLKQYLYILRKKRNQE